MTRHQKRLNTRYARAVATGIEADIQAAQDAVIGDALYRRNQARVTPQHRAIRNHGLFATARDACKRGVDFIDFYCGAFGVMPREAWNAI